MSVDPVNTDKRFDIVALGEPLIEFNEIAPEQYRQGFGGDTANFAVAAARQGARVAYCTRVGDDGFGRKLLDLWRHEGIDTSGVQTDAAAHTGVYFVTHGVDGHAFEYLRAGSAASRMQVSDLPLEVIADTHYFHVSGISQAISASACDAVFAAIAVARAAGARISYDPNLRLRLWSLNDARSVVEKTIPLCDVFLPSLDEAMTLAGVSTRDAVFDWCAYCGAQQVVLKCGAEGAWVWQRLDGMARHVPGIAVQAVDATGAGDCFDGTLMTRLAAGDGLIDAVRYANVAAALSTTGYGAVAPIPDHATVLIHLANALLMV
ncbi:MAG: sugar kinase [Pseudomonadota bacterium]